MNENKSNFDSAWWGLVMALIPVAVLICLLVVNVIIYGEDATYGPNQIALLMAAATAALFGLIRRITFARMMEGVVSSLGSAIGAMLILLLIGSLAGTWMISGIVPAMIYYGLDVLSPQIFLFATVIVCAIVSVATGSSWSTIATVGIALLGIGKALGVNEAIAAGAIISGAYFGDKMSPLSDTTNLAAAMAGTDLFTHIRYMMWTTVPSFLIALGIFFAIGYSIDSDPVSANTDMLKQAIESQFTISPWLFIVPGLVLVMVIFKIDAIVALFIGVMLGGAFAVAFQQKVIIDVAGLDSAQVEEGEQERDRATLKETYVCIVNAMALETSRVSGDTVADQNDQLFEYALAKDADLTRESFDDGKFRFESQNYREEDAEPVSELQAQIAAADLMNGKGMVGMLNTIWLIVTAMCFGGIMEACGLLQRITSPLVKLAKSTGSLIATTAGSCVFVNVTASDQYLSIVVPGRMFRETYKERGLAPQNLSRTLEDAGTVTSVLVPWNTCGAAQQSVLGVSVYAFAPYCFFNIISPFMTILIGAIGFRIARLVKKDPQSE